MAPTPIENRANQDYAAGLREILYAMLRDARLTASQLGEGLPVVLDGATEGIPVFRSEDSGPEAWLRDGHPGRIKHWRYGVDHVIVEWFGFEDADVSEWVGFARDDKTGTYGLIPISENEYLHRCQEPPLTTDPQAGRSLPHKAGVLVARGTARIRRRLRRSPAVHSNRAAMDESDQPHLSSFNEDLDRLRQEAPQQSFENLKTALQQLFHQHSFRPGPADVTLLAHLMINDKWPTRHPIQALGWAWTNRSTASFRRRLAQLRSKSIAFIG